MEDTLRIHKRRNMMPTVFLELIRKANDTRMHRIILSMPECLHRLLRLCKHRMNLLISMHIGLHGQLVAISHLLKYLYSTHPPNLFLWNTYFDPPPFIALRL